MSYLVYFFDTCTLYTSLILVPCILLKNTSSTERRALMLPPHPDVRVLLPLDQLILVHRIWECFGHISGLLRKDKYNTFHKTSLQRTICTEYFDTLQRISDYPNTWYWNTLHRIYQNTTSFHSGSGTWALVFATNRSSWIKREKIRSSLSVAGLT